MVMIPPYVLAASLDRLFLRAMIVLIVCNNLIKNAYFTIFEWMQISVHNEIRSPPHEFHVVDAGAPCMRRR